MDSVILNIIFLDSTDKKFYLRLADMRSNITSNEIGLFANKLIDDDILTNKGNRIVTYVGTEKITKEML